MGVLAFALMAPWLVVLSLAYWWLPRSLPATPARRRYDVAAIVLALAGGAAATALAWQGWIEPVANAAGERPAGAIWPDVLGVLYAYGGYLAVLFPALVLRQLIWRRR